MISLFKSDFIQEKQNLSSYVPSWIANNQLTNSPCKYRLLSIETELFCGNCFLKVLSSIQLGPMFNLMILPSAQLLHKISNKKCFYF